MSVVYLKLFKEAGRTELTLEENMEDLTVKELHAKVSNKTEIPPDEFALVYAGRVLKPNSTLSQYRVANGCTLLVLKRPPNTPAVMEVDPGQAEGFNALLNNRRVLTMIGRVLGNPSLLQAIIAGTPLEGNQVLRDVLSDPELLSSLSDPDSILEYLKDNPHMSDMMEGIMHVYHHMFGEDEPGGVAGGDRAVEMAEENPEQDIETAQQDRFRMAQEEMFEHSQALHAHQQQRQTQAVPSSSLVNRSTHETGSDQSSARSYGSMQRQEGGGGITQGQLASALAQAMNRNQQPSPLSSLDIASGPPSLSAYTNQTSSVTTPVQSSNRPTLSEQAGTITRQDPTITRQDPISNEALQQALATAMNSIDAPTTSQEPMDRMSLRQKYSLQLEQMHMMGIMDDAVSIQALEVTGGNLQAALEIIYSR